ncbi:hypothetical protein B4O97_13400 [Marispirochaeta aestuarii]|uniref:Uncharacterized protein n=1 Tax=Marispirochaeta aestuarii TaxID=1963862 RepID=A0A1Y1RX96_9SPIO|nr:hypothetical protein [Marispirochaeta aestuarii]ORC34303.1 hypothetical protein B4O97_13400 [Marispirochaeta aestuarii]
MKRRYRLLLAFLAVLGYLIFFPRELSSALTLTPQAIFDLDVSTAPQAVDGTIPFVASGYAGFLDPEGRPLYTEKVRYGAAVSAEALINYDSVSTQLVLRNREGDIRAVIETRGYPFFLDDRLLVISTDRLRLGEYTPEGEQLWSIAFPSLVTTCVASGNRTLVGLLNGTFLFLDQNGSIIFRFEPPEGRIKVAYGAAMDASAEASVVVAGIDPQTAYLLEELKGELNNIDSFPLESELRRNISITDLHSGRFAIEQENGLLVLDRSNLRRRNFSLPGRLLAVAGHPGSDLLAVLSREEADGYITLLGSESRYRGHLTLPGTGAGTSIVWSGNRLILIADRHVLVYRLESV